MNLVSYRAGKLRLSEQNYGRILCVRCLQPERTCYCAQVKPFDPGMRFVILIHPLEVRRRIATGRMSHLCLQQSQLITGHDYSCNATVNALVQDKGFQSVILYPGPSSINLSGQTPLEIRRLLPTDKPLNIFVIDGTWNTARKMLKHSQNLNSLTRISFTPKRPSNFRVRKQPKPECYSTVEAIHHTIELLGPSRGYDVKSEQHGNLLHVFDKMVEQQLEFVRQSHMRNASSRHARGRADGKKTV